MITFVILGVQCRNNVLGLGLGGDSIGIIIFHDVLIGPVLAKSEEWSYQNSDHEKLDQ
jgi:hypothetical protein